MIIDHIDNLRLAEAEVQRYWNELGALRYLSVGLRFLNAQVQQIEAEANARASANVVYSFGNDPLLEGLPMDLVACSFHWYAVTACNYVKLVGWIGNKGREKDAARYLTGVIPKVEVWRNKVGAHFARHTPKNGPHGDTAAELAQCVMYPIGMNEDALFSPPLDYFQYSGRKGDVSGPQMRWSLTRTHQDLTARYWPEEPAA